MLFWVFVVAWFLSDVFWYQEGVDTVLVFLIYFLGYELSEVIPNYYFVFTACQYLLYFFVGFKIRKKLDTSKIPICMWIVADIGLFVMYYCVKFPLLLSLLNFLIPLVGAIMAFEVLQKMAIYIKWEQSPHWINLSSNSMPIYLFHQQIIYVVIMHLNGKINPYLNAFFNFVVALSISYYLGKMLRRWKITRFLIGEK